MVTARRFVAVAALLCAAALAAAQEPPTKSLPFDAKGEDRGGIVQTCEADQATGVLKGAVSVKSTGYVTAMAGAARPYVRWNYAYNGTEPARATVALKYTFSVSGLDVYAGDPTAGDGCAEAEVGIRIIDQTSGNCTVMHAIESKGSVQLVVPFNYASGYQGQQVSVTFQPGHSYTIDAYLTVRASIYGGESQGVAPTPGGTASASATATISSMRLYTLAKPWVRCKVNEIYSPTHDTYDRYERALQKALGKDYFAAGAYLDISAGGRYDVAGSSVAVAIEPAGFLRVKDSPLAYTNGPTSVTFTLPDCYSLPLEGKTWRVLVLYDPEYQTLRDDLDFGPPLFRPVTTTLLDLDRPQRAAALPLASDTPGPLLCATPAARPKPATGHTLSYRHLYNLANWSLILPATTFADWFRPKGALATTPTRTKPARSGSKAAPVEPKPLTLNVQLYTPPGHTKPALAMPGLAVKPLPKPTFVRPDPEFSTEPVVMVSLLELYRILCQVPLPNDLQWCANPPCVQFLERLAGDAEAFRKHLDSLYLRTPDGQLWKLTDLDEEHPTLSIGDTGDDGPAFIWLPRRIRHWIRRAAIVGAAATAVRNNRPTQRHRVSVSGHVQNSAGQFDNSQHSREYSVVFDLLPKQQPWALGAPMEGLGVSY